MISFELKNLDETILLGKKIAHLLNNGDVVFLVGDLGAGKTTLVQSIVGEYNLHAKSPTFSLVNLYVGKKTFSHIDLYRLESYEEALGIGIEDILADETIKLIEWPEILGDEPYDLKIEILKNADGSRTGILYGSLLKRENLDE